MEVSYWRSMVIDFWAPKKGKYGKYTITFFEVRVHYPATMYFSGPLHVRRV